MCLNRAVMMVATLALMTGLSTAQQPGRDAALAKPLKMGQRDANTFVGIISDSLCGAKHRMADKTAEECTRACVRNGAKYVLIAGDKTYTLNDNSGDLAHVAGQKARVTGSLQGSTIMVNAVDATQ